MAKVLPISGAPSAELMKSAFGKARAMELGIINFQKHIKVSDGFMQFRRDAEGRVTAFVEQLTNKGYQFMTTGPQVLTSVGTGDYAGLELYRGYTIKVNLVNAAAKAKAIASSVEPAPAEPDKPPRWEFVASAQEIGEAFPRKGIMQVQAIPEHQYFAKDPSGKSRTGVASYPMMVDTWAQDTPISNLGHRGSALNPLRSIIDVAYDVAPSLFEAGAERPTAGEFEDAPDSTAGNAFAPDSDWMKRGAFVRIEHEDYGARVFCVLSDISNRFYVYPVDAPLNLAQLEAAGTTWPDQSIKAAVLPGFVQSAAAPLPAWCRAGSAGEARAGYRTALVDGDADWGRKYRISTPQYRWAFNSTCTKACAVVFEDVPGIALGDPAATVPQRGTEGPVEESLPGLVELGLHIDITGENPEDFTFSLTLDRQLQPTVTKDYVLAADYAWVVKQGGTNITELDDLILLKGAIYHTSADRQLSPGAAIVDMYLNALKGVVTVRNHTQGTDLRKFLVADTALPYAGTRVAPYYYYSPQSHWKLPYWEAIGLIVAYDLRILAFVVQQRLIVQDLSTNVGPGYSDRHQGVYKACQRVLVYAHNALVQEKKMDPDSTLNAQLVDVFDDTDTSSLFLFPVDDVGLYRPSYAGEGTPDTPTHMVTAYRWMDIMRTRWNDTSRDSPLYWYGVHNVRWSNYGGSFNAGPFLYYTRIANTLRCGPYESFTVFGDGSWSIATAPFYYYSGAGTDLANKYPFKLTRPANYNEQINLSLMKQDMVDIINFRITNPKTGAVHDVKTTHLAMANKALGKTWAKEDFMCEFHFEEENTPVPGPSNSLKRHLVATTQTPGADDRFLVFRSWDHYSGTDPVGSGNPAYLDPRVPDENHMYAAYGPVLRGASLFY